MVIFINSRHFLTKSKSFARSKGIRSPNSRVTSMNIYISKTLSDMSSDTPYPNVGPKPDLPNIEKSILSRWSKDKTFQTSINERPQVNEYVFYDGPPFANGLPHHGHLLTGYVKDVIPRYHTMRGKRVERRFGWDCHGLPAEMESEKQLLSLIHI